LKNLIFEKKQTPHNKPMTPIRNKTPRNELLLCAVIAIGLTAHSRAQTPIYSINGSGGTGGGTAGISVTPSISPSGSSALTDLGATSLYNFGTGPDGVAGESIVNGATGQGGSQALAGTLGASSSLSAFTVTMWVNQSTATLNNYRILEISPGAPATTGSADGTKLFLGLNSGGGLQTYVNNVNGNSVATDIAPANTWNNGGTLGNLVANNWYFVAFTYDTVAGNALLYSGDKNDLAVLADTYGANVTTAGNLDLSANTSISLLDRFSGGRDYPGAVDDVNIYSGALSQSQIDAIQVSEVPEPSTLALAGLGGALSLVAIVRRRHS
jgi:hypothetical protein